MIIGSLSLIPKLLSIIGGFEVEILDDNLETIAILLNINSNDLDK